MPRLKANLPLAARFFTRAPNYLFDHLLPGLKDTELRVLLVLVRATYGWNREGQHVTLPLFELAKRTGRRPAAIRRALASLSTRNLIHNTSALRHGKRRNEILGRSINKDKKI